jgi:predicted methyltransferase
MFAVVSRRVLRAVYNVALAAVLGGSVGASAETAGVDYTSIVVAPDRSDADRRIDRREPASLLAFADVRPGMKVLDVGAGAGYSAELLARLVGEEGAVYAPDSAEVIERSVKNRFDVRLQSPVMKHGVHLVRDYDDPAPQDLGDFDRITFFFFYHDTAFLSVDRVKMTSGSSKR